MPYHAQRMGDVYRTVQVPWDGETITVTYRLSALGPQFFDWVRTHEGTSTQLAMEWIEKVATDWDILDEHGNHTPVTVATMEQYQFPMALLNLITNAITEDGATGNLKASWSAGSPSASGAARAGTR